MALHMINRWTTMACNQRQMTRELERIYSIFITRVVRRPQSKTAIERLPILICAPDFPVPKYIHSKKSSIQYAAINESLHYYGILLVPPRSRLRVSAETQNEQLYAGNQNKVTSLDVRQVT
jgi:hypothetical protein